MTKEEIVKKLKDNWIKPDGNWKTYERAKRLICPDVDSLILSEYDFRLEVITDYLKI